MLVVSDTFSLLALLASPAVMIWLSTAAESWQWFQAINANAKFAIIAAISLLLAIGSFALQEFLAGQPGLLGTLDGYVKVALPILTLLVSQITHGGTVAKARIARGVSPKAITPQQA